MFAYSFKQINNAWIVINYQDFKGLVIHTSKYFEYSNKVESTKLRP